MRVSVTDAEAQLIELVRRAEAGDEVILTRHGLEAVRLVPVKGKTDPVSRLRLLEELRGVGRGSPGPDAARSQDFLYDEFGLPK